MTDQINEHKFDFKLPMFPNQTVSDNGMPCELNMDGQPLKGVSSLVVRAGSNGFTNVVMEFEASCAVEFAGHLVAQLNLSDEQAQMDLGGIYDQAMADVGLTEDFAHTVDGADKVEMVRRVVELCIERFKR